MRHSFGARGARFSGVLAALTAPDQRGGRAEKETQKEERRAVSLWSGDGNRRNGGGGDTGATARDKIRGRPRHGHCVNLDFEPRRELPRAFRGGVVRRSPSCVFLGGVCNRRAARDENDSYRKSEPHGSRFRIKIRVDSKSNNTCSRVPVRSKNGICKSSIFPPRRKDAGVDRPIVAAAEGMSCPCVNTNALTKCSTLSSVACSPGYVAPSGRAVRDTFTLCVETNSAAAAARHFASRRSS